MINKGLGFLYIAAFSLLLGICSNSYLSSTHYTTSCSVSNDSINLKHLCGNGLKYWDSSSGYSWLIKCDSTVTAYAYNYEKKRVYIKFNEKVVIKNVPYKLKHDTLIIQLYRDYSESYKIIGLSDNKMELVDLNTANKNIIRYNLSSDQKTMPIEAPLLSSDTSTWPVKKMKSESFEEDKW